MHSLFLIICYTVFFAFIFYLFIKYRRLIKSLGKVTLAANAIRDGDLSKSVKISTRNEVSQLADDINKMIDALRDREIQIKEYQRELQGQKEYLEAIFNSLTDGIITISSDCKIIKVNPTVVIWIGLEEEEIAGRNLTDFLKCNCSVNCFDNLDNISETCPIISQNERLLPSEAKIISMNSNRERLFSINSAPVSGIVGEPNYVILLRDITEFKETYQLREDFIATLTHDLRVPILAESNTLKLFLKGTFGPLNNKQIEAMENMLESNNDLIRMVNSLLDTYRYESDKAELYKEPVHIKKLIQDCIAELTPLAKRNEQTINNMISKDVPLLNVDRNEIKRVVRNLVNNSIAYTPKGGSIIINAEYTEKEVLVSISDNGKGIPESELEMIFDRYFSKAKKFRKIGTGLGLYLSKQIIEKHSGKIWAESKLGEGSTFYFSLPVEE